ncbi:MAG: hypothetical protein QXF24_09860, partial [Thermoproteota archaeon]
TPMLYFSVANGSLEGGAMITASHNPKEYNGMKFCREKALSFSYESGIKEMARRCLSPGFSFRSGACGEIESKKGLEDEYLDYLLRDVDQRCGMDVLVEVGNGCCAMVGRVLSRMGCKVSLMNPDPDGRFPNGTVNPAKEETVKALKEEVLRRKADIGVALDVDGDRVCFVDEKGLWTQGDVAFAIIAEPILEKERNAEVVADVRTSRAVIERLRDLGGRIRFSRVGHSYIANAVIGSEAKIGGELSGHIYTHDRYYGYDDGIYATVRMIETLASKGETLSEAKSKIRKMSSSPEVRVEFPEELKFRAVANISETLKKEGIEVNELDGVRADFERGWFSIRASNTEPCLVLRMEGEDEPSLQEMASRAYGLVIEAGRKLGHDPSFL